MSGAPDEEAALAPLVTETSKALRAPWAAGIAGIAFSILFTLALLLIRNQSILDASDQGIADWFADGGDTQVLIAALYLMPFAGVAFLWFIAVVRDQFGEHDDRFFGSVFYGSGLLFVALLFIVAAIAGSLVVGVRYLGQPPPSAESMDLIRSLGYTLLFAIASRAAALFIISTATIGRRGRIFPRWFALLGYANALILLLVVSLWDWIVLVLPAWVAIVSVFILRREWSRRRG
jgi:hypothetical protein